MSGGERYDIWHEFAPHMHRFTFLRTPIIAFHTVIPWLFFATGAATLRAIAHAFLFA